MSFLGQLLQPATRADVEPIACPLNYLDDDNFAAIQEIDRRAEADVPALRKVAGSFEAELRRFNEGLLAKWDWALLKGEPLRARRALEVLELTGTAEARQVLRKLAQGHPAARLTRDAKASLERLSKRPTP